MESGKNLTMKSSKKALAHLDALKNKNIYQEVDVA
jgi:hypothetical protein